MRLRTRLVVGFVAAHLLLSAAAGAVAWSWLDARSRNQAEASARAIGGVLAGGGFSPTLAVLERMRELTGYAFRVLTHPEAQRPGTVQVGAVEIDYRTASWQRQQEQVLAATCLLFLGGSAVFALVAWRLGRQVARPVELLAESARAIGAGTWGVAVPSGGAGEVAELGRELERMRVRLIALDQAHRGAERLATLGTFTATIAHEVRNPLSAVRLAVQLLLRQQPGDRSLIVITEEIERLDLIVDELLSFSRGLSVRSEPCDLLQLGEGVMRLLQRQADHAGVAVQLVDARTTRHGGKVMADPLRLRQLLLNLLLNGIQAAQGSASEARVRLLVLDHGCVVEDSGPGVAPELVPHLFEAFRTGREDGTGLGLHLAKAIAEAHGAQLRYARSSRGTEFQLDGLPAA
jgi:two-component system sensor histidine kinase AtoS